jgi:hypothetical protein
MYRLRSVKACRTDVTYISGKVNVPELEVPIEIFTSLNDINKSTLLVRRK